MVTHPQLVIAATVGLLAAAAAMAVSGMVENSTTCLTPANGSEDATAMLQASQSAMMVKTSHTLGSADPGFGSVGSEPRTALRNTKNQRALTYDDKWRAGFNCERGRCDWFKIQKTYVWSPGKHYVVIRTDTFPQSALASNLWFEGNWADFTENKIQNEKSRWWYFKIHIVAVVKDNEKLKTIPHFMLGTYDSTQKCHATKDPTCKIDWLASKDDGRLTLISEPEPLCNDAGCNVKFPPEALWSFESKGTALSPSEATAAVATGGIVVTVIGAAAVTVLMQMFFFRTGGSSGGGGRCNWSGDSGCA